MLSVSEDYALDVDRGPNWLFLTLRGDPRGGHDGPTLAQRLEQIAERHFTYRLILDLSQCTRVSGRQIGQMLALQKWLHGRDGMMRLCGLSAEVESLFRCCGLDRLFCVYRDRQDAVLGRTGPRQPR